MSRLSKDNSTVMSLRVPNDQRDEFVALAKEVGVLTSRQLRAVFDAAIEDMRDQANERRRANGLPTWEEDWRASNG